MRHISHSEAARLLDCQAAWDFSYGDQLAGSSLKPKTQHVRLREGKAWGRAMAAYHSGDGKIKSALDAMAASVDEDAVEMMIVEQAEVDEMRMKLATILGDYVALTQPIGVHSLELALDVPIPSRNSKRASTRYRFTGYIDAIQTDTRDRDWIVEFKLRGQLSSLEQVAFMRQIRWYAWAYQQQTGRKIAGVIVEERLNQTPKAARILKDGSVSKAKDQLTTPGMYAAACREHGQEIDPEVLASLGERKWQQRHIIFLSESEIEEAGLQLTSVAKLASMFDSELLFPVRNPSQFRCPSCAYRDICNTPNDADLVDALFTRVPAKKDRQEVEAA